VRGRQNGAWFEVYEELSFGGIVSQLSC